MATTPLQIGIIGGGAIGNAHMKNFTDDPRTEIRWLAEINAETRAQCEEKFSIAQSTDDHRRLLDDPRVDAVVVCTPPLSHVPLGLDILAAGKHLLVEKPLAVVPEEAYKLLQAAQAHPELKISGCSARHARLNPKYAFVKQIIDDGQLGRIYYVHHRAVNRQGRGGIDAQPGSKWFLNRKIAGGGPLYDWGVYDLSFHLGLLNQPACTHVESFCINGLDRVDPGTPIYDVEEHGAAMLTFANGMRYYWERANNANAYIPNQTTIYGTQGGLTFGYCTWDNPEITYHFVEDEGKGKAEQKILTVDMSAHPGDMPALSNAFIAYLLDEGPVPMPLDIEYKNLSILHDVYRAAGW